MEVSAASRRTSLQLHRVSALLWGRVLEAKLYALERAVKANFDPNQPRVPAGNPDGGQWTDAGGGGSGDATSDVRVAQVRRGRRGRGSDAEATQAQLIIRDVRQAQARDAIRRVQEIDPGWRPRESADTGSVPGQIRRAEGQIREAEARLRELARQEPRDLLDAFKRSHVSDLLGESTWSPDRHTAALCKVDELPYIGVNSGAVHDYTLGDVTKAMRLRTTLMEKYPHVMSRRNVGQKPNDSLFHAEVTCLLRASNANNGTLAGKNLEVYVDRPMCWSCETTLPLVGLEIGNPTVTFTDVTGRVRTMRNGKWLE